MKDFYKQMKLMESDSQQGCRIMSRNVISKEGVPNCNHGSTNRKILYQLYINYIKKLGGKDYAIISQVIGLKSSVLMSNTQILICSKYTFYLQSLFLMNRIKTPVIFIVFAYVELEFLSFPSTRALRSNGRKSSYHKQLLQ